MGYTYQILEPRADPVDASKEILKNGRLGRGSLAEDHAWPQDNGMLKVQLLDGILHTYLHLAVWHVAAQ